VTGTIDVDLTALGFEVVDSTLTLFERDVQLLNDAPCVPKKTNL